MVKRLLALAVLCGGLGLSDASAAQDWVTITPGPGGSTVSLDVSGVSYAAPLAKAWQRQGFKTASQTAPNGKRYRDAVSLLNFDCVEHSFAAQQVAFTDSKGVEVDAIKAPGAMEKAAPGSAPAKVLAAVCAVALAEDAEDITKGDWRPYAQSEDDHVITLVAFDDLEKHGRSGVLVTTRKDYPTFRAEDGLPYRHAVETYAFDCRKRQMTLVSSQLFISPTKSVAFHQFAEGAVKAIDVGDKGQAGQFDKVCAAKRIEARGGGAAPGGGEPQGSLSMGTGWATNKGYLVTASHVVTGGKIISVYQDGHKVGEASLVGNDPTNDVAVLKFLPEKGRRLKIIPLADKPGALGKSVFTLGFPNPDVMGQAVKMSAGDIAATSGMQDDTRFMQISIPIQQGNSGGPVIGYDGAAVGVVSAKLTKFSDDKDALKPENVNYAVKVAYVRALLDGLPDLADYSSIRARAGRSEDLIAQASQAVFMLVVSP